MPDRCPYQDLSDVEIKALTGEDLERLHVVCWRCDRLQHCWVGREVLAAWALTVAAVRARG